MTQTSSPWEGLLIGDATSAPYSALEWAHYWKLAHGMNTAFPNYGVLLGTGDSTYGPLQPIASGSANVDVKVGAALVNGKLYETDAAVTNTVAANASGNPRIDTLVLRIDYTAQTIRPVILQGTPAGSPVHPTLTQNSTTWEMPLADIAVANGFSTITQANISDRRRYAHTTGAGWLPYAYPVGTNPADDHASTISILAADAIGVPFQLAGNMLLDQLNILTQTTVNAAVIWGIYQQDVNDSALTNKLVKRVGGRTDNVSTIAFTAGNMIAIPADKPIPLAPGQYWLLFIPGQNLTIGAKTTTASRFNNNTPSYFTNTAPSALVQTIDLIADGYSAAAANDQSLAIRFEGRILDQTSAF